MRKTQEEKKESGFEYHRFKTQQKMNVNGLLTGKILAAETDYR